MKILHVTDFHFNKAWFRWLRRNRKKFDAICLTGDLLDLAIGEQREGVPMLKQAQWVLRWLSRYDGPPLFICSGNHDDFFESHKGVVNPLAKMGFLRTAAAANPLVLIDGTDTVLFGYRFVCAGWKAVPAYVASQEPVILLTHSGPDGSRVAAKIPAGQHGLDAAALVEQLPPGSIVLCGHEHSPRSWRTKWWNCMCINPGSGTNTTRSEPNRVIIEPDRNFLTLETEVSTNPVWTRLTQGDEE